MIYVLYYSKFIVNVCLSIKSFVFSKNETEIEMLKNEDHCEIEE